jgi:putative spermidine/putrescine transport system substrate-binding protein
MSEIFKAWGLTSRPTRRRCIAAFLASTVFVASGAMAAAQETLVVADAGGAMADALAKWLYEPFEKETGIKIIADHTTALGKAQAMAKSGNVVWDVFLTGDTDVAQATQDGILLPIDWSIVSKDIFPPEIVNDYGVPSAAYALVMTYNTDLIKEPPTSWADWWDTAKYNCPRTMRNVPVDNLEAAALSAGVPAEKIYPVDLDVADQQLDKIQPNVVTFWDTGAQSIQLVADGSACLGTAWTTRVTAARNAGQPVGGVWNGAVYHQDYYTVMKGTKHPEAAMKFIAYATRPEVRAGLASEMGFIVSDAELQAKMDPESLKHQPTPEQAAQGINSDIGWWAENLTSAYKRYSGWLTQ